MPANNPLSTSAEIFGGGSALGSVLGDQVKNETEEERKKRLQMQQAKLASGSAAFTLGLGGF